MRNALSFFALLGVLSTPAAHASPQAPPGLLPSCSVQAGPAPTSFDLLDESGKKLAQEFHRHFSRLALYSQISGASRYAEARCVANSQARIALCPKLSWVAVDQGYNPKVESAVVGRHWLLLHISAPFVGMISGTNKASKIEILGVALDGAKPAWLPIDPRTESIDFYFDSLDEGSHAVTIGTREIAPLSETATLFPTDAICVAGPP